MGEGLPSFYQPGHSLWWGSWGGDSGAEEYSRQGVATPTLAGS